MPILNYTTQIKAEKTYSEIQSILVAAKAQAVLSEYDDEGILQAIMFRIKTPTGLLSFRLPLNIDGVYKKLYENKKVPRKLKTREQAVRVTVRILKDWVEAQLAIVEAELATLIEVFLPYAQDGDGDTLYQALQSNNFKQLELKNG